MKTPDTPNNEQARLEKLRSLNVLDTMPEERFDRLTRIAKRMFKVPIALVSIVDENRQWFKSCIGLDVSETSREISFCGHTILDNDVFIIPDTHKNKHFIDNPLVTSEPFIRFYAGCPLTVNGYRLGTLCIIDQKPRNFTNDDMEGLIDLASMVERELSAVQLATLDELTEISNRRGFMVLSQHSLDLCIRQKSTLVLVFFDLNKFKLVNDKFGHAEGDYALIAFTQLMKETLRGSDLFARLGGDEFVALLDNTTLKQTNELIHRFSVSLTQYNKEANRGYDISFSWGIVEYEQDKHSSIDELLSDGDKVMYQLKPL